MHKKLTVMFAIVGLLMAIAAPVFADPADGNGAKSVGDEDREFTVDCNGTEVLGWADGWVQFMADGSHVGHIVYTYTYEGETFTFVETYWDTNYLNSDGHPISSRRGLMFDGRTGFFAINETTDEQTVYGQSGETADDQACAALVG